MLALPRRAVAYGFLLLNTIAWGAALPIVKPALSFVSPTEYLFGRFVLASLLTLPIVAYYTWKQPSLWKNIGTIIGLELIGTTITLWLIYEGLARTSSLEANLIATTVPLFIVAGGVVFLRERQEHREWLGLTIALSGTVLLTLAEAWQSWQGLLAVSVIGNLLVFSQNITESGYFLLAKKRYEQLPKFFVTAISFWVGAVSFGAIMAWQQRLGLEGVFTQTLSNLTIPSVALAVGFMATFGSILGLTAYIIGQSLIEASEASLFRYLQPLVYIPLSVFLLGERVTPVLIVSMFLIGLGVFIAEYRDKTQPRRGKNQRRGRTISV